MARGGRGLRRSVVAVVVAAAVVGSSAAVESAPARTPAARVTPAAQKAKSKKKKAAARPEAPGAAEPARPAADAGGLKFSTEIAPILVANCADCHIKPAKKRGGFDMSTFQKLIDGSARRKVILAGNPDESNLVVRIRGGDEDNAKMPQGGNRNLADDAVERIAQWVKEGARLDAGIDPKAPLESYASSPEDVRRSGLARLTPEQRDKLVEEAGLARWKKASPGSTPVVSSAAHFLLFSALPPARAASALKKLEDQYGVAKTLLGARAVDWGEKGSVFVFNDAVGYGEFVQAHEQREPEPGEAGTARLTGAEPYVAVVDPLGGRDLPEPSYAAARRGGRPRKGKSAAGSGAGDDAGPGGTGRSLAGLITEQLVAGAASRGGKPPRWLTLGLGAAVASRVEPGSPYYRRVRRDAAELYTLGWVPKATDALADQEKTENVRAVGFAVVEWLAAADHAKLAPFLAAMGGGGEKLDAALGDVLNLSRPEFLAAAGEYVLSHYGR